MNLFYKTLFSFVILIAGSFTTLYAQVWQSTHVDSWGGSDWNEIARMLNAVDGLGRTDTIFYDQAYSGNWEAWYRSPHYYNAEGQLVERKNEHLDGLTTHTDMYYTYNADGTLAATMTYQWNAGASQWQDFYGIEYAYNASGQLFMETHFTNGANGWGAGLRYLYFYDAAGDNTLIVHQSATGGWHDTYRWTYTYTPAHKPDVIFGEDYMNSSGWINDARYTHTYNPDNTPDTRFAESWDTGDAAWNSDSLITYFYNPDGSRSYQVHQRWLEQEGSWENHVRQRFYYYDDLGVAELSASIHMYPNPVTEQLTVSMQENGEAEVVVCDLSGKELIRQSGTAKQQVSFERLTAGVYVLTVMTDKGKVVRKIVKQE